MFDNLATNLFATDYKPEPYWWEQAPLDKSPDPDLPAEVDVLVVYQKLTERYGDQLARDILAMGKASLDYVGDFVHREDIDCNFDSGTVVARKVIVATNGYTGQLTPWQRRRVIPIGSYIIATEEIDTDLMHELFPTKRMIVDSRKLVYYYRACPEHKRVLFGGRVSLAETDPNRSGPKLHADMVELFPPLAKTKISHSWAGTVAYTFDTLMHCGEEKGLHYAMGYCGSGVGMVPYTTIVQRYSLVSGSHSVAIPHA